MTDLPPTDTDDISAVLQRVHQLGTATETLFSRLYDGLSRHNRQAEREAAVAEITEQIQQIARRNRQLRQMVRERDLEAERLQAILASISEGIIMHDSDGRIIMMNQVAQQLVGRERDFWDSELGSLFEAHKDQQAVGSELALLGEARRVQIGNRTLGVQIVAVNDDNGQRMGTLIILRDATDDELAPSLKRSFVTHLSHELITPLAPMRVASEILLNTPDDQPPNRRMLTMIGRNIDILDRMVRELLDMAAMTTGDFQIQRKLLALEDMLWNVVSDFSGDIKDAKLDIVVMLRDTDALYVEADEKYLTWALGNLLRNAIQYTEPDQRIVITAGLNPETNDELAVQVIDTGVGISDEDMPNIFNLFFRGEPRARSGKRLDPRGLGQGLFVARTVAQAHGGNLRAESLLYEGSTFTLTLPRADAHALPDAV